MSNNVVNAYRYDTGFNLTGLKSYNKGDVASSPDTNVSASGDTLGTASNLDCTGTAFRESGILEYAIQYDGVDDKSIFGSSDSQFDFMISESYEFSFNFWYEKLNASPNFQSVFLNSRDGSSNATGVQWKFDDRSSVKKFEITFKQDGTNYINNVLSTLIPQDTNYHMITCSGIHSDNGLKWYLDAGTPETVSEGSAPSGTNSMDIPLEIAQEEDTQYWAGKLCEISIWNRVLSSDEITTLYNSGNGLAL